jgi:hypothetical protein
MQLGLLGTANTIAHSVRVGRGIAEKLKSGGMIRRVSPKPKDPLRLSAVCATGKRSEAFGGYLYLAVAVRRDISIQDGQVAYGTEDSVCEIDMLPYGDIQKRMGLKQYEMMYRLLRRILSEPSKPDILLIDRTLLLPREFANSEDPQVTREFQTVAKSANEFWTEVTDHLYPKSNGGMIVVGYPTVKRMSEPLMSIASDRSNALIDKVALEDIIAALGRGKPLDDGSAARIMGTIIWPEQRSAAFTYSGLSMDARIEPSVLHQNIDIASFHYRAGLRSSPQQVEIAGGAAWTTDGLDRLAEKLIEATPFDQPDAVPLPLWLGRKDFDRMGGDQILEQYQRNVFHVLRSGELDKAWLRGWEPDGE